MKAIRTFALLFFLGVLFSTPAFAANPASKLTRGLINATTGWLEIPAAAWQHAEPVNSPPALSSDPAPYSFLESMRRALQRTLYGFWDIASFPFPPYDQSTLDPETLVTSR